MTRPGSVCVIVPVFNAADDVRRCLDSLLAHHCASIGSYVLIDDASTDPTIPALLDAFAAETPVPTRVLRNPHNLGFVQSVNTGFAQNEADVIILNSDTIVTEGWADAIVRAADSDARIGIVTPMSNNATITAVPRICAENPLPDDRTLDEHAKALRDASQRVYPDLPTAVGFCMLVRRSVLRLVGGFDPIFGRGYNEENDLCMRARGLGFRVVLADDAYVWHRGGGTFGAERAALERQNARILGSRHPHYTKLVQSFIGAYPDRVWNVARMTSEPLEVCIDGTPLAGPFTGTQRYIVGLAKALAARPDVRVTLEVRAAGDDVAVPGVRVLATRAAAGEDFDVYHRPFHLDGYTDWGEASRRSRRRIVTQHDAIALDMPSYFRTWGEYEDYRRGCLRGLAEADGVITVSDYSRERLVAIVPSLESRVRRVYNGVDHLEVGKSAARPDGLARFRSDLPFLLYVGTDFPHKNLDGTVRALEHALRTGLDLGLVIAGPSVPHVGSRRALVTRVAATPALAGRVVFLDRVSDRELEWLYAHCFAVAYLSLYEGFGFLPFEATAHGKPVVASRMSSIGEVFDVPESLFDPGDFDGITACLRRLLDDAPFRDALVAAGRRCAAAYTWDRAAAETTTFYREILGRERRAPAPDFPRPRASIRRLVRSAVRAVLER